MESAMMTARSRNPATAAGRVPPRRVGILGALALLGILLAGCGGVRDHLAKYNTPPEKGDPFVRYMNARVGTLTFDEALAEWGHPSQVTDGDRIFLATWGPAEAQKAGGEFGRLFLERKVAPEENVNVVFQNESRTLESWGFSRY
jgi:hypothetical protein